MFEDLIAELEQRSQNIYTSLRQLDIQRESLTRQAIQIERAIQALRLSERRDESEPLPIAAPDSSPRRTGEDSRVDPFSPRPTRDAIRSLLRDHGGELVSVHALVREMTLLGWLDPDLKAPTEAVRYAAKVLARDDPNVERVGVTDFRWMPSYPAVDTHHEEVSKK